MFLKRDWLNPAKHIDTGHIKSEVLLEVWEHEAIVNVSICASFCLADCTRTVDITLSCDTQHGARQRLKKLKLMIDHLYGIHDAIEENMEKLK